VAKPVKDINNKNWILRFSLSFSTKMTLIIEIFMVKDNPTNISLDILLFNHISKYQKIIFAKSF